MTLHHDPIAVRRSNGAPATIISNAEWLARKVDRSGGPDACWPYMGSRIYGYGDSGGGHRVDSHGSRRLHRLAWEIANGPLPVGAHVLHSCDNPPCCNPAHLRPGTPAENTADMMERGRWSSAPGHPNPVRGMNHPRVKLTDEQVAQARDARRAGVQVKDIAASLGVGAAYVSRMTRNLRRETGDLLPITYPPVVRPPRPKKPWKPAGVAARAKQERRLAREAARATTLNEMRVMYEAGASTTEVGAAFGVHGSNVSIGLRSIGVTMRPFRAPARAAPPGGDARALTP